MIIRNAAESDLKEIMAIYEHARNFMRENGNPTQWGTNRPGKEVIMEDIRSRNLFVCVENGNIAGTFAFIIGEEPNYIVIEQGDWHYDMPYGTIHRLASNGRTKGIAKACFDFCKSKMQYIRIDTHENNKPMQAAIKKNGFEECGIIYVADKSPRIAYDYYNG